MSFENRVTNMNQETEILKIYDEGGNWDLCECVKGDTRVIRVIESYRVQVEWENREYAIQYSHACGYKD